MFAPLYSLFSIERERDRVLHSSEGFSLGWSRCRGCSAELQVRRESVTEKPEKDKPAERKKRPQGTKTSTSPCSYPGSVDLRGRRKRKKRIKKWGDGKQAANIEKWKDLRQRKHWRVEVKSEERICPQSKGQSQKPCRFQTQNMDFKKLLDIIVFTLYLSWLFMCRF